jgi:hypothetical protein
MANGHGGARRGAGRPRGSRDRIPRRRPQQRVVSGPISDPSPGPFVVHPEPDITVPEPPVAAFDPETFDPILTLKKIAADERAPAVARVAACKAVVSLTGHKPTEAERTPVVDRISARAIQILTSGRLAH